MAGPKKENLAFIGARGAGKSKFSRKFGKVTGQLVLSTDSLISYEAGGITIPEIVKNHGGWLSFREQEYHILAKLCKMHNIAIDCGGGILVEAPKPNEPVQMETFSQRKADLLREHCTVVYLKRDMSWLIEKIQGDQTRPDLSVITPYKQIVEQRLPWYEAAADIILDMRKYTIEDALEVLLRKLDLNVSP